MCESTGSSWPEFVIERDRGGLGEREWGNGKTRLGLLRMGVSVRVLGENERGEEWCIRDFAVNIFPEEKRNRESVPAR